MTAQPPYGPGAPSLARRALGAHLDLEAMDADLLRRHLRLAFAEVDTARDRLREKSATQRRQERFAEAFLQIVANAKDRGKGASHDATCYLRHAKCLASRLLLDPYQQDEVMRILREREETP